MFESLFLDTGQSEKTKRLILLTLQAVKKQIDTTIEVKLFESDNDIEYLFINNTFDGDPDVIIDKTLETIIQGE
jgi:hypothetical protein